MTNLPRARGLIAACLLMLIELANPQIAAGSAQDRSQAGATRADQDVPSTGLILAQSDAVLATPASGPAAREGRSTESTSTSGLTSPPSPLQTAGPLAGALLAIVLAICGVTVTFRSMREETRRGRGSARRSVRHGAAVTPPG